MKTSRGLLIWATLVLCGIMVLGAMTWLTRGVLATEKERAEAEARADLEERTRLALWRMDALGAAITTRENALGPDKYRNSSLEIWWTRPPAVRPEIRDFHNSGHFVAVQMGGIQDHLVPQLHRIGVGLRQQVQYNVLFQPQRFGFLRTLDIGPPRR